MWVLLAGCEIWMFKLIRERGDVIIIMLNVPEYHGHKTTMKKQQQKALMRKIKCFYCVFDINLTSLAALFTCRLLKGVMKNKLNPLSVKQSAH